MIKKSGQIWVETVLYTLIILALIGLVLAFVSPRIQVEKDKIVVEQTINILNAIDDKINIILEGGADNLRIVEVGIQRGALYFNSSDDTINFEINDLEKPYSEPGEEIEFGMIKIVSTEGKKKSSVYLSLDYSVLADLTFAGGVEDKKFTATSVPYRFSMQNLGVQAGSPFDRVDVDLIN